MAQRNLTVDDWIGSYDGNASLNVLQNRKYVYYCTITEHSRTVESVVLHASQLARGVSSESRPVSYTHLDVYKRQL